MGHYYDCMVCGQENGPGGCACPKKESKKMNYKKLDEVRSWICYSHSGPEDVKTDAGFPDDYKFSDKELEYIFSETDNCEGCGITVELGDLNEYDTGEQLCSSCFQYAQDIAEEGHSNE